MTAPATITRAGATPRSSNEGTTALLRLLHEAVSHSAPVGASARELERSLREKVRRGDRREREVVEYLLAVATGRLAPDQRGYGTLAFVLVRLADGAGEIYPAAVKAIVRAALRATWPLDSMVIERLRGLPTVASLMGWVAEAPDDDADDRQASEALAADQPTSAPPVAAALEMLRVGDLTVALNRSEQVLYRSAWQAKADAYVQVSARGVQVKTRPGLMLRRDPEYGRRAGWRYSAPDSLRRWNRLSEPEVARLLARLPQMVSAEN
jgi:hypothetical protein